MADCLSAAQQQERFDLIGYAVDTLTRNPATAVYVDAGHPRWVAADVMAARLNQVGVAKARASASTPPTSSPPRRTSATAEPSPG